MGDGDWYRDARWDSPTQEIFWRKFKAARRQKHWAAVEKSGQLWFAGLREEARLLLQRAEDMAPNQVDSTEQRARFAMDEGNLAPAEDFYRGRGQTLDLAKVLARHHNLSKRRESRELFADWYRKSGWGHAPDWEHSADLAKSIMSEFDHLAETLVMAHFEHRPKGTRLAEMDLDIESQLSGRNPASVGHLDEYYRVLQMPGLCSGVKQPNHPNERWQKNFLLQDYVPALGAYLGEMLVKQRGGAWERGPSIPRSSITVGTRVFDPFRHAFDVVFYYASCLELLDSAAPLPG